MTTDEGTSNNGENPTAAVLEQGEDITTKKDRGVLKVRHGGAQRGSPALREGEERLPSLSVEGKAAWCSF